MSRRRPALGKAALLGLLSTPARAWIVAPDMAPGIPDRLVRIGEVGCTIFFEDVAGSARSVQRCEDVIDVAEIGLRKSADVIGRSFGFGKIAIELRPANPLFGNAMPGIVDER